MTRIISDYHIQCEFEDHDDRQELTEDMVVQVFGAPIGQRARMPPKFAPGTFVNNSVTSIWEVSELAGPRTVAESAALHTHRATWLTSRGSCTSRTCLSSTSRLVVANNSCCVYDTRLDIKTCARCVRSHKSCSFAVAPALAKAGAAVNKLEGTVCAGTSAGSWVDEVASQYSANRCYIATFTFSLV